MDLDSENRDGVVGPNLRLAVNSLFSGVVEELDKLRPIKVIEVALLSAEAVNVAHAPEDNAERLCNLEVEALVEYLSGNL